jgi:hypothetical protein
VSPNADVKVSAAVLLKLLVTTTHISYLCIQFGANGFIFSLELYFWTSKRLGCSQVGKVVLKSATQQIIPALVTLGTDPNVDVKIATIDAFGAVAQRFKEEEVQARRNSVEK